MTSGDAAVGESVASTFFDRDAVALLTATADSVLVLTMATLLKFIV
jgi:hypothetical protein